MCAMGRQCYTGPFRICPLVCLLNSCIANFTFCFDSQQIKAAFEQGMADNTAETALKYLRDPAVVAGLGAVAVASMYYLASRPCPQPCPVDPQKQSFELPASILTTCGKLIKCLFFSLPIVQ